MKIKLSTRIYELDQVDLTNRVCLFTDGSGTTKDSPGGWAFVITYLGDKVTEGTGYEIETTNNRMELSAAIRGLRHAKNLWGLDSPISIALISDSMYVLNQAAGNHATYSNEDLIEQLREAVKNIPDLVFVHVKGHSGHVWNERADELAKLERKVACDNIKISGIKDEQSNK